MNDPTKGSTYLKQLINETDLNLESMKSEINSIKTTQNILATLSEHPRINGILQLDDNFAFPGQVNTSGEVFLKIGDYKISLTPTQAIKHLENKQKMVEYNIELGLKQQTNFEEKLKMSEEILGGQKQIGEEITVDDRTTGRVFQCGVFFEIVEFQQNDGNLAADLKATEKNKRIARVKNEEEKQIYLKQNI